MPLRLFFYISEILRKYSKNDNQKSYDKNITIPAVIPIVLYNGASSANKAFPLAMGPDPWVRMAK